MTQRFINDRVEHNFEFSELCTIVSSLEASVEKFQGSLKSLVADNENKYRLLSIGIVLGAMGKAAKLLDKLYITDPKNGNNEPYLKVNFLEADVAKVQELVNRHSHPELASEEGMVTQVWADGEVTSQKSGSLLGQRSLHTIEQGVEGLDIPGIVWPEKNFRDIGFIYTNEEGKEQLREAMVIAYVNAILGEKVM